MAKPIQDLTEQIAKQRAALLEDQIAKIQAVAMFPVDIKVPTVLGGFTVYHIEPKLKLSKLWSSLSE